MTTAEQAPTIDPPHSRDLQDAVLACALRGRRPLEDVLEQVDDRLLYGEESQALLGVLRAMHAAGVTVDVAGVRERIRSIPEARRKALELLLLRVVDASRGVDLAALKAHIDRLRQYAGARALQEVGIRALSAARDPETAQASVASLAQALLDAGMEKSDRKLRPIGEVAREVWDEIARRSDPTAEKAREIRTGFIDFDARIGPMRGLVLLAARPGVGKTSLGLQVALNVARAGIPVLFETLEMQDVEIAGRALASLARIDTRTFTDSWREVSADEWTRMGHAVSILDGAPVMLQQAPTSVAELRRDIQRLAANTGIMPFVVLDRAERLQELLSADRHANRNVQCALVAVQLAALSHDLDAPLLCMLQMSRESERDRRPPRLIDLRDSGGWEQEADRVIFIWDGADDDGAPAPPGTVQLRIPKNRSGARGQLRIAWMPQYTLFGNLDTHHDDSGRCGS